MFSLRIKYCRDKKKIFERETSWARRRIEIILSATVPNLKTVFSHSISKICLLKWISMLSIVTHHIASLNFRKSFSISKCILHMYGIVAMCFKLIYIYNLFNYK